MMIVQLVQSILDVPDFADEGMSQLAVLIQNGQSSNDILPLLSSNCDEIIFSGAWIATTIQRPLTTQLTEKLRELLNHSSVKVRDQASTALRNSAAFASSVPPDSFFDTRFSEQTLRACNTTSAVAVMTTHSLTNQQVAGKRGHQKPDQACQPFDALGICGPTQLPIFTSKKAANTANMERTAVPV